MALPSPNAARMTFSDPAELHSISSRVRVRVCVCVCVCVTISISASKHSFHSHSIHFRCHGLLAWLSDPSAPEGWHMRCFSPASQSCCYLKWLECSRITRSRMSSERYNQKGLIKIAFFEHFLLASCCMSLHDPKNGRSGAQWESSSIRANQKS